MNSQTETFKGKTICLIQITRIGDVIQTVQAAKTLKIDYPNVRLVLVARKGFAKALEFITRDVFDAIHYLDLKEMTEKSDKRTLKSIKGQIHHFVEELNQEKINVSINFSFSKSSTYLHSLIESEHKLGARYNSSAGLEITDKWSQHVYSSTMKGPLCPFNLVDIYRSTIGASAKNPNQVRNSKPLKNIVLHPFASDQRKCWDPTKWTEIIYKVLKEFSSYTVTIVGSESEKGIAKQITQSGILNRYRNRVYDKTGQTSMQELAKILEQSILFVGHDSMVGHMASLHGVQTFTISLGSVRPHETTPYGAGNYNIAPKTDCYPCFPGDLCEHKKCHADIPYQLVNESIAQLIQHRSIDRARFSASILQVYGGNVAIYESVWDEKLGIHLNDLMSLTPSSKDIFRTYYRIIWQYFFNGADVSARFPTLTESSHKDLYLTLTGVQNLYELAEFGKKYSQYILEEVAKHSPDVDKIKEYAAKIDEIDQLQAVVRTSYPFVAPLIDFFTVVKGNLPGKNVVDLAESSYLANHDCSTLCSVLYDLIEKTIAEYKLKSKSRTRGRTNLGS